MLLAFTVSSFVYFSFANIYSSEILNYQNFSTQFHSGIYQYRILSGYFLDGIYHFLGSLHPDYQMFRLRFLSPDADPQMYLSFYILNTLFLMLSSGMMVLIAHCKTFIATPAEKLLFPVIGIFVMALSQFVIVPYDCSSYFFILLFFRVFLGYLDSQKTEFLIILCIILLISALNRESAALSLSLAATLLYRKFGTRKETLVPLGILTLIFVLTYIGMRISGNSFSTNDGNLFFSNLTDPKNMLGLLFWIVFFCVSLMLAHGKSGRRNILLFHLFALPYLIMCFYTGILYEIRLYVPVFLTALFLGRINLRSTIIE